MSALTSPAEQVAMRRAVELAARGLGTTSPNPVVGCVLLAADDQRVVGEGWHERPGGPHAEVVALQVAGAAARAGTAVVTLEPCAHTGRTGPCVEALISAGIRRVVYAVDDPHAVASGGAARLRQAGVDVVSGLLSSIVERGNEAWLTAIRRRRPHVTYKVAATLDGRAAAADGSSRWISSEASRAEVHELRRSVDAVVVGVGTVLADDPSLTARDSRGEPLRGRQPLRVVVDTGGRTPSDARLLREPGETWVATAAEFGRDQDGGVDLSALLRGLSSHGVVSVLLEGGPRLAGAFLARGLIDRVTWYVVPALLGEGLAALSGAGITSLDGVVRLRVDELAQVGGDVKISGLVPSASMH